MKILVFSPYYPPHIGGLESHSEEFNQHIAQADIHVTVFTPRLPIDAPETETQGHVRIIRFPAFEIIPNYPLPQYWPFYWTSKFWRVFRDLRKEESDIVISRTRFFSTSLLALAYAKLHRIPFVHIEHGSDYAAFNNPFKTLIGKCYDRTFGWLVLRGADHVIANSHASALFVQKLSGREATLIHRGIETENILAIEPDESIIKAKNGRVACAYIGRLIDGKGVADLLSAIARLDRNDFICYIVGDGSERARLETMSKQLRLEEKVIFVGHKKRPEAIAIMKACDIIINPSYNEGLPTSVTEAALASKAIIATDVGGTREIISGTHDGFLIPCKNHQILSDKMDYLIEHPEIRTQFGENAQQEVLEKFSWNRAIAQYLSIFRVLLETERKK